MSPAQVQLICLDLIHPSATELEDNAPLEAPRSENEVVVDLTTHGPEGEFQFAAF